MPAKKNIKIEVTNIKIEPEVNPDILEIVRLRRVARANQHDCDSIYNLYKKYIQRDAPQPCHCPGSHLSIANYYSKVRDLNIDNLIAI